MKSAFRFIAFIVMVSLNGVWASDQTKPPVRVKKAVWVYPQSEVIYFLIEKNASSSVREMFPEHPKIIPFRKLAAKTIDTYTKFLVIRDPYTRAISSYQEVMKVRPEFGGKTITPQTEFFKLRHNLRASFKAFLEFINHGNFYELHTVPQSWDFGEKQVSLNQLDFIADVDHLTSDLACFSKAFHIPMKFKRRANCGHAGKKNALTEIVKNDPEIRQLIEEVYAEDFIFYKKSMERREKILKQLQNFSDKT